jgi:hypothetical protein
MLQVQLKVEFATVRGLSRNYTWFSDGEIITLGLVGADAFLQGFLTPPGRSKSATYLLFLFVLDRRLSLFLLFLLQVTACCGLPRSCVVSIDITHDRLMFSALSLIHQATLCRAVYIEML